MALAKLECGLQGSMGREVEMNFGESQVEESER